MATNAKKRVAPPSLMPLGDAGHKVVVRAVAAVNSPAAVDRPTSGHEWPRMTADERRRGIAPEVEETVPEVAAADLEEDERRASAAPTTVGGDPDADAVIRGNRHIWRMSCQDPMSDVARVAADFAAMIDMSNILFPGDETTQMNAIVDAQLSAYIGAQPGEDGWTLDERRRLIERVRGKTTVRDMQPAPHEEIGPERLSDLCLYYNKDFTDLKRCSNGLNCLGSVIKHVLGFNGPRNPLVGYVPPHHTATGNERCIMCMIFTCAVLVEYFMASGARPTRPLISVAFKNFPPNYLLPEVYSGRDVGTGNQIVSYAALKNAAHVVRRTRVSPDGRSRIEGEYLEFAMPDYFLESRGVAGDFGTAPMQAASSFAARLSVHPTSHIGQPPTRPLVFRVPGDNFHVRSVRPSFETDLAASVRSNLPDTWSPTVAEILAPFDDTVAAVAAGRLADACREFARSPRLSELELRVLPVEDAVGWALGLRLVFAHDVMEVAATAHSRASAEDGARERNRSATARLAEVHLGLQLFVDSHIPLWRLYRGGGVSDKNAGGGRPTFEELVKCKPRRELAFGASDFMSLAHLLPYSNMWHRVAPAKNGMAAGLIAALIDKALALRCKKRSTGVSLWPLARDNPELIGGMICDLMLLCLLGNFPKTTRRPCFRARAELIAQMHAFVKGGQQSMERWLKSPTKTEQDRCSTVMSAFARMIYDFNVDSTPEMAAIMIHFFGHELRGRLIFEAAGKYADRVNADFERTGRASRAIDHVIDVFTEVDSHLWPFLTRAPEGPFADLVRRLGTMYLNVLSGITRHPEGHRFTMERVAAAKRFLQESHGTRVSWPEQLKLLQKLFPRGIPQEFCDGRHYHYFRDADGNHPLITKDEFALLEVLAKDAYNPQTGVLDFACLVMLPGISTDDVRYLYSIFIHSACERAAKTTTIRDNARINNMRVFTIFTEFCSLVAHNMAVTSLLLPEHVTRRQIRALRTFYDVAPGEKLPANAGTLVVCADCHAVLTVVYGPGDAKDVFGTTGATMRKKATFVDALNRRLRCRQCPSKYGERAAREPLYLSCVGRAWCVDGAWYTVCEHGALSAYTAASGTGMYAECGHTTPAPPLAARSNAGRHMSVEAELASVLLAELAGRPRSGGRCVFCRVAQPTVAETEATEPEVVVPNTPAGTHYVRVMRDGAVFRDRMCVPCYAQFVRRIHNTEHEINDVFDVDALRALLT